jgi:hypothetical protein
VVFACAGGALAQTARFSVSVSPAGPVTNGALVSGVVRVDWTAGTSGAIGYAGGRFRLRMDGLGISDVLFPNGGNGGINSEAAADRVGVPVGELTPPAGTVSDQWTFGRRPVRAYLTNAPNGFTSGGGFRFPPLGTGPTDMHYSVEQQSGVTYLTGRHADGAEDQIEQAQNPPALLPDPLFFESAAGVDLFKFQVRAPLTGGGTVTITPEVAFARLYTSASGAQVTPTVSVAPGTFTYTPSPSSLAPLAMGLLAVGRRRRSGGSSAL